MADEAWDEFVHDHPHATGYHLRGWREVVHRSFGQESVALVARAGRELQGVLPLFLVRRGLLRPQIITGPFGSYDGAIALTPEIERSLYDAARSSADEHGAEFVLVKCRRQLAELEEERWHCDRRYTHSILDLPASSEVLWKGLRAEMRNRVRRAQKEGLEVRWDRAALPRFYQAFSHNVRDLGSPVQPLRFFQALLDVFGERASLVTVWCAGEVIGGAICYSFKTTLYVPWAGCLRSFFRLNPNQALYWAIMSESCGKMTVLDLGRSTHHSDGSSGTHDAKKKWGASTHPVYHYCALSHGRAMSGSHERTEHLLSELWKRLPLWLANTVGPRLIRYYLAY